MRRTNPNIEKLENHLVTINDKGKSYCITITTLGHLIYILNDGIGRYVLLVPNKKFSIEDYNKILNLEGWTEKFTLTNFHKNYDTLSNNILLNEIEIILNDILNVPTERNWRFEVNSGMMVVKANEISLDATTRRENNKAKANKPLRRILKYMSFPFTLDRYINFSKKTKHVLSSILFALTSILYFFLAYIGYTKQNIDLTTKAQHENYVTSKGIGIRYGSKGRTSNVFYMTLKDLEEKIGVYRMSKDYSDLLSKINVGDKLRVYYKPSKNTTENINIDLIQVEKDGKVLISKTEYEQKESFLIYIGLIAGFGTLFFSYRYYKYGHIFKTTKNNYR
jgi:hypothetical protein